ncbi:MAG TPA: hypothetical protein ENK18_23645 [Deltaproteobacteria bacterium]|nr:hypothetical protein [Deltaproteobacteria bacterium]
MADSGLLIGWDKVAAGRESHAVELWGEMLVYLRRLHAEGILDRFEPVLLGAHGGHLNGFVLVWGSLEHLEQLRNSEEFLLFNVRAQKTLDGFAVIRAHFGDEAAKILRLYGTA